MVLKEFNRIHLFNHAEDAWEANLADWLDHRSRESFSGHQSWFVTGSFVQANWIRRMALSQGQALFGIQFFDLRTLRKHLCHLFGLPTPSFGRETLQILLEEAAGNDASGYTTSRSLLDALDELAAAGWLDQQGLDAAFLLLRVPERLRPALQQLTSSEYWKPRADSILLQRVTSQPGLSLGVFGLDAECLRNLKLLLAAARGATQSDFWIAQPLGKEALAFQWITTLEQGLNAGAKVCPTGCARRPYESFLAHWQGGGERNVRPPEILIANRWHQQVDGIVQHVAKALVDEARSILVVVPENSGTGRAVVHQLISRGIAVADEIREKRLLPLPSEVQVTVAGFLAENQAPESFLRIAQCLIRSPDDYKAFRDSLLQAFDNRQVRSLSALITERHRQRFPWLRDLEVALEPWPEEGDWMELRQRWESVLHRLTALTRRYERELGQFIFTTSDIEPLWHEIGSFLKGRRLHSQLFLKFMVELLAARSREPHPGSHHRYAKVVVATAANAHATSWDYVILADANSDAWPLATEANPVLNDEEKRVCRRGGVFLVTGPEQRQIEEERYLQLAYHARKHLLLARYEQDERGTEAVANDLTTFAEEFLEAKVTPFQTTPRLLPLTDQFRAVWANRLNPEKPFDEYFLNFESIGLPMRFWHPSELEAVIKTPGTFAFRLVFNCRREFDRQLFRSAPMTLGRIAHRLLQRAFGGEAEFQALKRATEWSREEAYAAFRHEMQIAFQHFRTEHMARGPDLWWETILGRALALASRMLESLTEQFNAGLWYQSEGTLNGAYGSQTGNLALEGRTDLILSDRDGVEAGTLRICDFKTSKQVQPFKADTGDGLQFLGYRLLAEANGARQAEILVVKPDGIKPVEFPSDAELAPFIELLVRLQYRRSFGRRPGAKWQKSEQLPIATLPIDPDILDRKLQLTWKAPGPDALA